MTVDKQKAPAHRLGSPLSDNQRTQLEQCGFRLGQRGTHGSRSMMLEDLEQVMAVVAPDATYEDFETAIFEENVLGKKTKSNSKWTWKKLRELYGLNRKLPIFAFLQELWYGDEESHPLLAILCACARDPILRGSTSVILSATAGDPVDKQAFEDWIEEEMPDRFSDTNRSAIASRLRSSWTQSGHLTGGRERLRQNVDPTPRAAAYALFLGHLAGGRGQLLFRMLWPSLLDSTEEELMELAAQAAKRSLLDFRRTGTVVQVTFPHWSDIEVPEVSHG